MEKIRLVALFSLKYEGDKQVSKLHNILKGIGIKEVKTYFSKESKLIGKNKHAELSA